MSVRIGVDTGGTFTDVVGEDLRTGRLYSLKTPSTPGDPGAAVLNGLRQGESRGWWRLADISAVVHGTTVATNALLQRRGPRTALVTTRGFRDVLAIQRQNRPEMYNLRSRRPEPLVPRQLRMEVRERMLPDGTVETPLHEGELATLIGALRSAEVEAVVVGLLHSYANPAHELAIGEALKRDLPGVAVCFSHQIACEPGEFERLSTACINGFVQPVVQRYLERLATTLQAAGVSAPLFVMKSSGGAGAVEAVAKRCVETAVSGPAGGVRACRELAAAAPGGNLIAADVGGTSFDVAVITGGEPQFSREATMGGLPLRVPMLDIHTIGAGGGSLAWIDGGRALRVGPHSAGAQPGPACYGRGGDRPTVTDANLVLGRLAPASRLAGGMRLDLDAARRVIERDLAKPLGLAIEEAALGILRVANAAMVMALRQVTVERGIDPRHYTLCPYGGAGPLHAAELAAELGASRVLVPPLPGVFSAFGLLNSELRADRFAALSRALTQDAERELSRVAEQLATDARQELDPASPSDEARVAQQAAALRYRGQTSDLLIDWPPGEAPSSARLTAEFHDAHQRRYGFSRAEHEVHLAGVAVAVEVAPPEGCDREVGAIEATQAAPSERTVWFTDGPQATPVYDRQSLPPTWRQTGPLVVEQDDTTTLAPPGWSIEVWPDRNLVLTKDGEP